MTTEWGEKTGNIRRSVRCGNNNVNAVSVADDDDKRAYSSLPPPTHLSLSLSLSLRGGSLCSENIRYIYSILASIDGVADRT